MAKKLPKNIDFEEAARQFGTPIHVYDMSGIESAAKKLKQEFGGLKGYKNYFAVKATPTPKILKFLHQQGMGFDCSSRSELKMIQQLGYKDNDIFYSSNNTPKEDFELAIDLGAVVNIDDLTQIDVFLEALNGREYPWVALRYNPGNRHTGNAIIGNPVEAKYGLRYDQLLEGYNRLKTAKIGELGMHIMAASNELDEDYFRVTAELVKEAREMLTGNGVKIDFINLGGGFGVAYRPEDKPVDIAKIASSVKEALSDPNLEVLTESGRWVTGPHGYLLTSVRYVMEKYKNYVGVDASMQNLMRPGMYGAYHEITILGEHDGRMRAYDVSGSLCENNDKFAIDRELPQDLKAGDLLVVHDSGAHGHAMGFNYNGLLRSAEVLAWPDGRFELARRAENYEDYVATVEW